MHLQVEEEYNPPLLDYFSVCVNLACRKVLEHPVFKRDNNITMRAILTTSINIFFCLFTLGNAQWNRRNSPYNGPIPQEIMVDIINSFGLALLQAHNENNENNIAFSPYGTVSVLVAIAEGVDGPALHEIICAMKLPLDVAVTRVGLRDVYRHLKSYFIPKEGSQAGITFSHDNITLKESYAELLKFYGYNLDEFFNGLNPSTESTTTQHQEDREEDEPSAISTTETVPSHTNDEPMETINKINESTIASTKGIGTTEPMVTTTSEIPQSTAEAIEKNGTTEESEKATTTTKTTTEGVATTQPMVTTTNNNIAEISTKIPTRETTEISEKTTETTFIPTILATKEVGTTTTTAVTEIATKIQPEIETTNKQTTNGEKTKPTTASTFQTTTSKTTTSTTVTEIQTETTETALETTVTTLLPTTIITPKEVTTEGTKRPTTIRPQIETTKLTDKQTTNSETTTSNRISEIPTKIPSVTTEMSQETTETFLPIRTTTTTTTSAEAAAAVTTEDSKITTTIPLEIETTKLTDKQTTNSGITKRTTLTTFQTSGTTTSNNVSENQTEATEISEKTTETTLLPTIITPKAVGTTTVTTETINMPTTNQPEIETTKLTDTQTTNSEATKPTSLSTFLTTASRKTSKSPETTVPTAEITSEYPLASETIAFTTTITGLMGTTSKPTETTLLPTIIIPMDGTVEPQTRTTIGSTIPTTKEATTATTLPISALTKVPTMLPEEKNLVTSTTLFQETSLKDLETPIKTTEFSVGSTTNVPSTADPEVKTTPDLTSIFVSMGNDNTQDFSSTETLLTEPFQATQYQETFTTSSPMSITFVTTDNLNTNSETEMSTNSATTNEEAKGTAAIIANREISSTTEQLDDKTFATNELKRGTVHFAKESTFRSKRQIKSRIARRSLLDFVIAKFYDEMNFYNHPLPRTANKPLAFIVNGKRPEYNISFMTYDVLLPFWYIANLRAKALRFPLDSLNYYLLLILPESIQGLDELISKMRNVKLIEIVYNLQPRRVKTTIPRFQLKGNVVLTPTLQKLGIMRIFEPRRADFSKLTDDKNIFITNVEQSVNLAISNTMDSYMRSEDSSSYHPVEFRVDHPFLYFVMDSELNVALVAGKITNPLNNRIL